MATKHIDALIFSTAKAIEMTTFYKAIGMPLKDETHGDGPLHYACDLGGAHVAIYDSSESSLIPLGDSMIGFHVDSLEETLEKAKVAGAKVVVEPQEVHWGRRAVIEDPDGHLIEFNEG
jgi:predicted enzyme related to lactoylglutathione lyase